jgi:hypothetical protein
MSLISASRFPEAAQTSAAVNSPETSLSLIPEQPTGGPVVDARWRAMEQGGLAPAGHANLADVACSGGSVTLPSRVEVVQTMSDLGLDWNLATIVCCARSMPAFSAASAVDLTSAASAILDTARRFGNAGEIRAWYGANPLYGTVLPSSTRSTQVAADAAATDPEPALWPVSFDLTDAAVQRDVRIHSAMSGWKECTPVPLPGVFTSLNAVAEFAVESTARAYCYSRISADDLRSVREFESVLEGVPEAVVVKRAVLEDRPALAAVLLTYDERIARPRTLALDIGHRTASSSAEAPDDRTHQAWLDGRLRDDLVVRLRQEVDRLIESSAVQRRKAHN